MSSSSTSSSYLHTVFRVPICLSMCDLSYYEIRVFVVDSNVLAVVGVDFVRLLRGSNPVGAVVFTQTALNRAVQDDHHRTVNVCGDQLSVYTYDGVVLYLRFLQQAHIPKHTMEFVSTTLMPLLKTQSLATARNISMILDVHPDSELVRHHDTSSNAVCSFEEPYEEGDELYCTEDFVDVVECPPSPVLPLPSTHKVRFVTMHTPTPDSALYEPWFRSEKNDEYDLDDSDDVGCYDDDDECRNTTSDLSLLDCDADDDEVFAINIKQTSHSSTKCAIK